MKLTIKYTEVIMYEINVVDAQIGNDHTQFLRRCRGYYLRQFCPYNDLFCRVPYNAFFYPVGT